MRARCHQIVVCAFAAMMLCAAHAGSFEDFFSAVATDNAATVKVLLERGFDANAPDEKGQQALFLALRAEAFKVAAVLLTHPGIKLDVSNAAGETALMMAALRGQTDWARKLIERGAAVHKEGWSPLHYAATGPATPLVLLLLDRGATIDALSPNRTTPLMMAAQYGGEASVDLLLSRGASLRARNDHGLAAADFARLGGRDALAAKLERLGR